MPGRRSAHIQDEMVMLGKAERQGAASSRYKRESAPSTPAVA